MLLLTFSGWRFHFVKSETKKQLIFVLKLVLYYFYFDKNLLLRFNGWRFHFVKSETKKQIIFVLRKNVLVTLNFFVCVGNNCQRFCTAVSLWKKSDQKANYFNFEKMLLLRVQRPTVSLCKKWDQKTNYFCFEKKRTGLFAL